MDKTAKPRLIIGWRQMQALNAKVRSKKSSPPRPAASKPAAAPNDDLAQQEPTT